jgi:hypothetical protein
MHPFKQMGSLQTDVMDIFGRQYLALIRNPKFAAQIQQGASAQNPQVVAMMKWMGLNPALASSQVAAITAIAEAKTVALATQAAQAAKAALQPLLVNLHPMEAMLATSNQPAPIALTAIAPSIPKSYWIGAGIVLLILLR